MKKSLLLSFAVLLGMVLQAQTSGGPDAYGYTWKNSNHSVAPPVYQWVDITTRSTEIETLADDNTAGPFAVPNGFQFYWYPITEFWIGSNGYVSFNNTNIASPFPQSIPLPSGSNDWLGVFLADFNFSGVNNPGRCFYMVTNDSIVVSWIDAPYWTVAAPSYSGSNTFQVIISSIDKSITYNYKSMSAGLTPLPIDCAVGIENNTGVLGLASMIDVVPGNNFTIKYYYPSTVTYAVTDGGINWNNNDKNGGYFIKTGNTAVTLQTNVKNFGNQPLSSFTVTDTVYSGLSPLSNGSSPVPALNPGEDTTLTFSNSFIAQFPAIYSFATRVQGITGDLVAANNRKVQKIISVNTNSALYNLDYSDGVPDGFGLSWSGGDGGIAVYIKPPVYPIKISASQFYIEANGVVPSGFYAKIFDDGGTNGAPNLLLDSVYVPGSNVVTGMYNIVPTQNQNLIISSGGVYVLWYMDGNDIRLARDMTPPISARSFEVLGSSWAEYRSKLTEDFLIGIQVSTLPTPQAAFSIDSSAKPLYKFTDLTSNNPVVWHWDFDNNGDTSSLQNPSYTYTNSGSYNVCLTASNSLGSSTVCKTITLDFTSIDEDFLNYKGFVYPNPAKNAAMIDLPENTSPNDVALYCYNIYGQLVDVPVSPNGKRLDLDTKNLITGVYFFELYKKNGKEAVAKGKFSIEK